jgi:hypothetical protein
MFILNLNSGNESGTFLDEGTKWLIARYKCNDSINLITNPDFVNTITGWSSYSSNIPSINISVSGITKQLDVNDIVSRWQTPDADYNANFLKVSYTPPVELTEYIKNNPTQAITTAGIETTDWINVNSNTAYRCYISAKANRGNCRLYVYGNNNNAKELIATSISAIADGYVTTTMIEFNSTIYTQIKVAIYYTNPIYDDYFIFTNIVLMSYSSSNILDDTLFKNNATVYDFKLDCNSVFSDSCISLLGNTSSYLELKQPYSDNDCITMSFWFKPINLTFDGTKGIIYSGTTSSNLKLYIKNTANTLCLHLFDEEIDTGYVVNVDTWYHIAFTFDQINVKIYINGILIKTVRKFIPDFTDITYTDMNYYSRFGYLAPDKNSSNMISEWDGSIDTSWYTSGKSNTTFNIDSAEAFAGLAYLVNTGTTFSNCIINLKTNIDLGYYEWTPIGYYDDTNSKPFAGIFNGNNHEIKGLKITVTSVDSLRTAVSYKTNIGLFGYVNGSTSTVKSTITSIILTGTIESDINTTELITPLSLSAAGFVAKGISFKISDCTFNGSVSGYSIVSGIVGDCTESEVYNCINNGTIICNLGIVGGIAANLLSSKIVNCVNKGSITLSTNIVNNTAAGVIGYFYGGTSDDETKYYEISNCINRGSVIVSSTTGSIIDITAAGVVGQLDNTNAKTTVQGCQNFAEIDGIASAGGIIGKILSNETNINIYQSINFGKITDTYDLTGYKTDLTGYRNIGGILGCLEYYCYDYVNIYDCINVGVVTNAENAGGIIGIINNKTEIYKCINNGNIYENYNSGGILSKLNGLCKIHNCANYGSIKLKRIQFNSYIGAILANTDNYGYIYETHNNMYLDTCIASKYNIYDSYVNGISKTALEMLDDSILNFINKDLTITTTEPGYVLDYSDEIKSYLKFNEKYPVLESFIDIINTDIANDKSIIAEYSPLSFSVCEIRFYDVALSHRMIRELSRAKILHYKCLENEESNINYIPVSDGTYNILNIPINASDAGDANRTKPPVVSKHTNNYNAYGSKSYSLTFSGGSIATLESQYGSRVETETFTLNEIVSNYTFSVYIRGNESDVSKLNVIYQTTGGKIIYTTLTKTSEYIGDEDSGGIYYRYKTVITDFTESKEEVKQIIGINNSATVSGILANSFTLDIIGPQLENKKDCSAFISGEKIGTLYDISTYNKDITLDINTCPMYIADTFAYKFETNKKIIIPSKYAKMSKHFSIAFWMKGNTPESMLDLPNRSIINRSTSFFTNGDGWMIGIDPTYNDVTFEIQSRRQKKDVRYYINNKGTFDWTFITAVYDNGKIYAYKDGILISSNEDEFTMYPHLSDIVIGSAFLYDENNKRVYSINDMHDDIIRDIRIYNTSLTADDVLDIYQASGNIDDIGLWHSFYFNTNEVKQSEFTISKNKIIAPDIMNNSGLSEYLLEYWPLNGTGYNEAELNSNNMYVLNTTVTKGIKNTKSLRFNGNSYAYSMDPINISNNPVCCLAFWIKIPYSGNSNTCIMECGNDYTTNNGFSIYITENGHVRFYDFGIASGFNTYIDSIVAINDDYWHYVVINIIRCKNITFYIDNNKDVTYSNYAAEIVFTTGITTPENNWYNEIVYNEIIHNLICDKNYLYINRLTNNNTIKKYNVNGDPTLLSTIDKIYSTMQDIFITDIKILDSKYYFSCFNTGINSSYILEYDTSNTNVATSKKIIADSYYCSTMTIKNNMLYYPDRHVTGGQSTYYRCAVVHRTDIDDYINIYNEYLNYSVDSVISVYTGHFANNTFVKDSTISNTKYHVYNKAIIWNEDPGVDTYYVDFTYHYTEYTTYYVKAINLNNLAAAPIIYETKHNNIINSISVDSSANIYTASFDHKVKKTSASGIIWEVEMNTGTLVPSDYLTSDIYTWADCFVYKALLSEDETYISVACRNKTITKLDTSGNIVWVYTDNEGNEFNSITSYNNYIYTVTSKNDFSSLTLPDKSVINAWMSFQSKVVKLDSNGDIIWSIYTDVPATDVVILNGTNNIYIVYSDGEIRKINEIAVLPYSNNTLTLGCHNKKDSYYKGFIQDIKIFNKNLNEEEITRLYNLFTPDINKALQFDTKNDVFVYHDIDEMD